MKKTFFNNIEQLENGTPADRIIRLKSVYKTGKTTVQPVRDSITNWYKGVPRLSEEEKRKLEIDALEEAFGKLPCFNAIKELWIEFENGNSTEAIYMKDLDKLEMIIQAVEYKRKNPNLMLDEFI